MTAIAIWIEGKQTFIASDSRVGAGQVTYTDDAPKIMPLRVKYLHAPNGPFEDSGRYNEYAFCFSGRVELCTLAYAALANIVSHIGLLPPDDEQPSLAMIAELAGPVFLRFTRHYADAAAKMVPPHRFPLSTIALAGWCPVNKAPEVHELKNSSVGGGKINIRPISMATPHWMGSGATLMQQRWTAQQAQGGESPLKTLEHVASSRLKGDVGGSSQLAICDSDGYHVVATKLISAIPGTAEYLGFLVANDLDPALNGKAILPISQEA